MATILIRIQKDNRREALARVLGNEHEILVRESVFSKDDAREDLLILGHTILQQMGPDAVRTYKTEDSRPDSPVLLLVPSTQTSSLNTTTWSQVDDVAEIPIRAPVMKNRVDNLIRLQDRAEEADTFRNLAAKYKVMLNKQQREVNGYKALFYTRVRGVLLVNDGEIVEANEQAEQLFGTTSLVGQSLLHLFSSEQVDGLTSQEKADEFLQVREAEMKRIDCTFKQPEGQKFISTVNVRPVQFKGRNCLHILFPEDDTGDEVIPV